MEHIGAPIPLMAERVRTWLAKGVTVKIFTARATAGDEQIAIIQDWTERHFGERLPVTATKDFAMVSLFDDRAVQIQMNTAARRLSPARALSLAKAHGYAVEIRADGSYRFDPALTPLAAAPLTPLEKARQERAARYGSDAG
jgi:hypothetical protein